MTAPRTAAVTGVVTVDVSASVDGLGWLDRHGQITLWSALTGARGLPVRLLTGALTHPPGPGVLAPARECASVEVCGTDPAGVAAVVTALRHAQEGGSR